MADLRVATDATFEEVVLHNEKPVLVDFWAAWCGPCRMVAPVMEQIAKKYEGSLEVVKVDIDANPGLAQAFNVMSIPMIALFQPGGPTKVSMGFRPMEQLEQAFGLPELAKAASAPTPAQEAAPTA